MRAVAIALLSVLLGPQPAAARRASLFDFCRTRMPSELRQALELYEKGELFEAAALAERALPESDATFRDDFLLLRGLAFADLGWRRDAEESFALILEAPEPSPYYPLALLGLVESSHAGEQIDAVVEVYRRYWEEPWAGSSRADLRRRNLLRSYGEIRSAGPRLTEDEEASLAKPARLVEQLQTAKDYASERVLYLAGLDLFRAHEYRRSLDALSGIGILSLYFPYATYTVAQDLWALGDVEEARGRIGLIRRYPARSAADRALGERTGVLGVQMLYEAGRIDEAIEAARQVGGDGRYAQIAALLRAQIVLASDQPSLAVVFYGDLDGAGLGPRLATQRGLGLGEAYAKLGDFASATASLRGASDELGGALGRLRPPGAEREAAELRSLVAGEVERARRVDAARRRRIAAGMRRLIAFKGPMSLAKLARVVFAPHKNTIVGQPIYDLKLLAEREGRSPSSAAASEGPWIRYLESPRRTKIEGAESLRLELDTEQSPLRILDALLGFVEGRFGGATDSITGAAALVNRLTTVLGTEADEVGVTSTTTEAEIVARRRRLLTELGNAPATSPDPALFDEARREAQRLLDEAVTFELRAIVDEEAEALRRLEFELQTALSETIVRQGAVVRSPQGQAKIR